MDSKFMTYVFLSVMTDLPSMDVSGIKILEQTITLRTQQIISQKIASNSTNKFKIRQLSNDESVTMFYCISSFL